MINPPDGGQATVPPAVFRPAVNPQTAMASGSVPPYVSSAHTGCCSPVPVRQPGTFPAPCYPLPAHSSFPSHSASCELCQHRHRRFCAAGRHPVGAFLHGSGEAVLAKKLFQFPCCKAQVLSGAGKEEKSPINCT